MNIALGIDTGGTYTDAVLADHDTGKIYAGTKSLTTRYDLSVGIKKAIEGVFSDLSHTVLRFCGSVCGYGRNQPALCVAYYR